ncbi:MAG: hypothetical protein WA317_02155 [Mycobacterium sp.]
MASLLLTDALGSTEPIWNRCLFQDPEAVLVVVKSQVNCVLGHGI